MTLVQSAGPTVTVVGFPLSNWARALRIWAAKIGDGKGKAPVREPLV